MKTIHVGAVVLVCALHGCSTVKHGPALKTLSVQQREELGLMGEGEVDRRTVRDTRLSDADGREWTESEQVSVERVPGGMDTIKNELFQQALAKQNEPPAAN